MVNLHFRSTCLKLFLTSPKFGQSNEPRNFLTMHACQASDQWNLLSQQQSQLAPDCWTGFSLSLGTPPPPSPLSLKHTLAGRWPEQGISVFVCVFVCVSKYKQQWGANWWADHRPLLVLVVKASLGSATRIHLGSKCVPHFWVDDAS